MSTINKPLVSVVIITYNSARFVTKTLESVKTQSWQNIELIVSDDCSTDDTVTICLEWISENSDRFSAVKLITVPQNSGVSSNCNRGFRAASGEWVKMIAGDDVLMKNCITDNLDYIDRYPEAAFIVSDIREIDENGSILRDKVFNEGLAYFSNIRSARRQLKAYSRWPAFLNTPTFFCNRELIEKVGYCDEDFMIYEDMTMVFRIIENKNRLHYMKRPTVEYRVHRNAISRNAKMNGLREKEALKVFEKYCTKNLSIYNPLDLSVYYEAWLRFKFKGLNGHKGDSLLRKLSVFYWYMRYQGVKSY